MFSTRHSKPRLNRKKALLGSLLVFALAALSSSPANATAVGTLFQSSELPTLAHVVEKVENGIVNISAVRSRRYDNELNELSEFFQRDEFFRRFFDLDNRRRRQSLDLGSGVIIDAANGYVLTNHHVLENASEIHVTLHDGRVASAEVVGSDPPMDLALLKIDEENLQAVDIGDSDRLRVGDFVLAFGNNFGLSATVTSGIVSALGRSGLQMDQYQEFIQTDAAINQGSSGGALVNLNGEVIGINTAILSPGGGNIGIAFAIPINTASVVATQLIEFGQVERGVLGIHFQEVTEDLAQAFNFGKIEGVLVTEVQAGSAADEAGLKEGDILTHISGKKILDGSHLRTMVALIRVGQTADLQFVRDGDTLAASGIIGAAGRVTVSAQGERIYEKLTGLELRNDTSVEGKGVRVLSVESGSAAWDAGIREGDMILEVNRIRIESIAALTKAVTEALDSGHLLALKIDRDGISRFVVIA